MTAVSELPTASSENESAGVTPFLDARAFNRLSIIVTAWASLTMFVEGFEMQLVGYAAPAMLGALHVGKAEFGAIFGAGNFGFFLGALSLSALGDRFGRRRLIVCGVLMFSICTIAAAAPIAGAADASSGSGAAGRVGSAGGWAIEITATGASRSSSASSSPRASIAFKFWANCAVS